MRKLVALILGLLAGCSPAAGLHYAPVPTASPLGPGAYIKHVVVIIQENRTFENLFAGFPGADAPMFGYTHTGKRVKLHEVGFYPLFNLNHFFGPSITSYDNGKMDGFDVAAVNQGLAPLVPYGYLKRSEIAPYWSMASQYVLADHMFPTVFGPSFTGHLALIAGTTSLGPNLAEVNNPIGGPWGCDASIGTITFTVDPQHVIKQGPFPCFSSFRTMADTLDEGRVSWKYYAPPLFSEKGGVLWTAFDAIRSVRYGPSWKNVIVPQTTVLKDAHAGKLAAVSWVVPDWFWSDHTSSGSNKGPSWVSAIVNAIGTGPDWNSTAVIVVWDDWGGWYDNVPPPQMDYRGLGIRVGCIIISPYARPHYVSHTQYEFGSILKFIEEVNNLPALGTAADGYTDGRATSIVDSFDFTQQPLKFHRIEAPYPASYFLKQGAALRPPDDDLGD